MAGERIESCNLLLFWATKLTSGKGSEGKSSQFAKGEADLESSERMCGCGNNSAIRGERAGHGRMMTPRQDSSEIDSVI